MGNIFLCFDKQSQQQQRVENKVYVPSEQDRVMGSLKSMQHDLVVKKRQINKQIDDCDINIRQLLQNKLNDKAKFVIKRKQLYEKFLQNIEDKHSFVTGQIIEVEKNLIDKDLNQVLKDTNKLLTDVKSSMDLQDQLDDFKENSAEQNRFNSLFKTYQVGQDDAVDAIFEAYEAELVQKDLQKIDQIPKINLQIQENIQQEDPKQNDQLKQKLQLLS